MTINPDTKNSITLTPQDKKPDLTWDEATYTWDDSNPDTWDSQSIPITKQTKNSVTITPSTKN